MASPSTRRDFFATAAVGLLLPPALGGSAANASQASAEPDEPASLRDAFTNIQTAAIRSGDESFDPAPVINAFLAHVSATRGTRAPISVEVPAGLYSVRSPIELPSGIRLWSAGGATIARHSNNRAHLITNSDRGNGNRLISVSGIHFDGRRGEVATDIPGRWCAYFSRVTDLLIEDDVFSSAASDGLCLEFINGGRVANNLCHDNVKPGIYLACCDHVIITGNTVRDCVQQIAYGIAVASSWYCTISGNAVWNCPNGGIGLGRDSRWNVVAGNTVPCIGTELEAMPPRYDAYLASVSRPNRASTGAVPHGAHDNLIIGNIVSNSPTASEKSGINLRASHRNSLIENKVSEHGGPGIQIEGSTDITIRGGTIENVGKRPTADSRFAVDAKLYRGATSDRLLVDAVDIRDTQARPTTVGIIVRGRGTIGAEVRNCRIALADFPFYEDRTTASLIRSANRTGLALTL